MKIVLENNGKEHVVEIPVVNADPEQIMRCFEMLVKDAGVDMGMIEKEVQLWAEEIELLKDIKNGKG